ncbi:hypothetical protein [Christiangramia aquimixticola]|uniref:hypothetical protein n=1 Tax=Christiangramia aquimixticola TaxID=1697558 RepID=UPI003AA9C38E
MYFHRIIALSLISILACKALLPGIHTDVFGSDENPIQVIKASCEKRIPGISKNTEFKQLDNSNIIFNSLYCFWNMEVTEYDLEEPILLTTRQAFTYIKRNTSLFNKAVSPPPRFA